MTDTATSSAIRAFHEIERGRCSGMTRSRIPPIARLGVVVAFLIALISFGRYDLVGTASLTVFPFAIFCFEGASAMRGLARYWYVLIPVGLVGAANPFFDRAVVAEVFGLPVFFVKGEENWSNAELFSNKPQGYAKIAKQSC